MKFELQELAEQTEPLDGILLPSPPLNDSFDMYPTTGPAKLTCAYLVPGVHAELLVRTEQYTLTGTE